MSGTNTFLYLEFAESLRWRIAAGELAPGDRLPTVRELAHQWPCTPGTVSRAERFFLEAFSGGHTPPAAAADLSVAVPRWEAPQSDPRSGAAGDAGLEPAVGEAPFRFAGSHDLAVDLLGTLLEEASPAVRLSMQYAGSLGGLMALARGVHEGEATAGLGIHAAAAAYGLDFVRLARERYELMLPEQVRSTPPARALVEAIRSPRVREAVVALGGYDTAETGHERWA